MALHRDGTTRLTLCVGRDALKLARGQHGRVANYDEKVELTGSITPDPLPILGDLIQLQQVILKLFVNGIDPMRDTPSENRTISIRISRVEKFAELSVSDRGPGIPTDKLKKVFEPFLINIALRSRPLALRRIADKLLDSAEQGERARLSTG
jgi:C4-dicarboxylate-specific signal transduction histidine kinase